MRPYVRVHTCVHMYMTLILKTTPLIYQVTQLSTRFEAEQTQKKKHTVHCFLHGAKCDTYGTPKVSNNYILNCIDIYCHNTEID